MNALCSKALGFLPSWVPFAAVGVLLVAIAGGFLALKSAWQAEGAAKVIAADQKAVLEQKERDAKLSALLVERQAAQLATLAAKAQTVITRIEHAPQTTGCGPVMRDASRGLHELFSGAGQAPAGREPPSAVPGSGPHR